MTSAGTRVITWNAGHLRAGTPTLCAWCLLPAVDDVTLLLLPGATEPLPVHGSRCSLRLQREAAGRPREGHGRTDVQPHGCTSSHL